MLCTSFYLLWFLPYFSKFFFYNKIVTKTRSSMTCSIQECHLWCLWYLSTALHIFRDTLYITWRLFKFISAISTKFNSNGKIDIMMKNRTKNTFYDFLSCQSIFDSCHVTIINSKTVFISTTAWKCTL